MATNLLSNPSFESGMTDWASAQGTITAVAGGKDGQAMQYVSQGTGNRNFQHTAVACVPGDVFSVEMYTKWVSGTPKQIVVMCQFLNGTLAQTGNIIGTQVLATTGGWSRVASENCVAPAGTAFCRVQGRVVSAALNDTVLFDDFWLNKGATVDRSQPTGGLSLWNGTTEVPLTATLWNGITEVPLNL